MKRMKRTMFTALSLFAAVAMAACGGGGGGDAAAPTPTPTINASSLGVITELGSVKVNGVTFSTTGATVTVDDNPSAADQLKVGMVVMVRGTFDDAAGTGNAVEIDATDALEGTISAVGANTLTVMGQTVQIEDNVTRLNDDDTAKTFAAGGFAVGQTVEVHAFPDDRGGLRATRVAKKAAGTGEFEMKGFVTAIAGNSFGLSLVPNPTASDPLMTVNFTGALPAGVAAGSFVHVKSASAPAGTTITASLIKIEDAIGAGSQKVKVEGVVTSGTADSFIVNGHPVLTNASTIFVGGLKTDFLVGVKVEAQGALDANRNIVATKVTFRGNIRIEGDVTAFTAGSSLTVLGKQVAINQYTRTDVGNGPIAVGSHVEVRAFADRDGKPVATRIIVRNPDARVFLQAPVTATGLGTMTILGTTVTTSGATVFRVSSDAADVAVESSTFFSQLKPNVTVVKARWADSAAFTAGAAPEQAEIQLGKTLLSTNNTAVQGMVTALGSVFVNGVRFHTGSAAIMVDGVHAAEADLKEGMVVSVRGTMDDATQTGTASLVTATNAVEGPIEAVGANTLTVMGLPVLIEDNVTRLNDDDAVKTFAAGAFAQGQIVEVNGFFDDNGGIRATRVAKKASGGFEVKGFVVSIGTGSFGLSLAPGGAAALTVNFTGSLPAGVVAGSIVEVKAAAAPVGGAITATLVKLDDSIGASGEKAKVEGIAMNGTVTDFTINGQQVITNAATLFEGGLAGDFLVGGKLEAEGFFDANGAIVATKISFRASIRFEAEATAIGAGRSSITLSIMPTRPIAINRFTRDDLAAVAGRHVEVRAYQDRDGNLIASRIVDRGAENNNRVEIQGPVTANDPALGTMVILGVPQPALAVPVSTAGATFRISSTATEPPVQAPAFFAQLKNNVTIVKVRWNRFQDFNRVPKDPVVQAEIQLGR